MVRELHRIIKVLDVHKDNEAIFKEVLGLVWNLSGTIYLIKHYSGHDMNPRNLARWHHSAFNSASDSSVQNFRLHRLLNGSYSSWIISHSNKTSDAGTN